MAPHRILPIQTRGRHAGRLLSPLIRLARGEGLLPPSNTRAKTAATEALNPFCSETRFPCAKLLTVGLLLELGEALKLVETSRQVTANPRSGLCNRPQS